MGVRSTKTQNVKNLRNFGEKLLGRTDFPPKSAPSSGKLCFSLFGPGPWPKTSPKPQSITLCDHLGSDEGKKLRKLRKTVPDSVVTFFFLNFGLLLLWGPERALRGRLLLAAVACCLLARRASSSLVP